MRYYILQLVLLVPWVTALGVSDWRHHRLPNLWVFSGGALGLALGLGWGGVRLAGNSLLAGLVCGLFLLLPFFLRMAGGGDVKMLFACGLWMTTLDVLPFLTFTAFASVPLALVLLCKRKLTLARVKHYLRVLFDWRYDRKAGKAQLPPADAPQCGVPYGIAIGAGAIMTIVFRMILLSRAGQ